MQKNQYNNRIFLALSISIDIPIARLTIPHAWSHSDVGNNFFSHVHYMIIIELKPISSDAVDVPLYFFFTVLKLYVTSTLIVVPYFWQTL